MRRMCVIALGLAAVPLAGCADGQGINVAQGPIGTYTEPARTSQSSSDTGAAAVGGASAPIPGVLYASGNVLLPVAGTANTLAVVANAGTPIAGLVSPTDGASTVLSGAAAISPASPGASVDLTVGAASAGVGAPAPGTNTGSTGIVAGQALTAGATLGGTTGIGLTAGTPGQTGGANTLVTSLVAGAGGSGVPLPIHP